MTKSTDTPDPSEQVKEFIGHQPTIDHAEALQLGEGAGTLRPESETYCYDYRAENKTPVPRPPADVISLRKQNHENAELPMHLGHLCPFWGRDDSQGGYGRGICTLLNLNLTRLKSRDSRFADRHLPK